MCVAVLDRAETAHRAEGSTDAGHREAYFFLGQAENARQLVLVDVQPLRRDVEVDAALSVRDRESRFRAERSLVLHADLVFAPDHDVRAGGWIAVPDPDVASDVAVGMKLRRVL